MKFVIRVFIVSSLVGCGAVKMSLDGANVRHMSTIDMPACKYISNVEASGGNYLNSYEGNFEAGFNAAMNEVASVGGDAYVIVRINPTGEIYEMEAWSCGWNTGQYTLNNREPTDVQEISANDRRRCEFIKSIPEGSNWGITKSRNLKSAREDAIKHVQEVGGNSYFVVNELLNKYGVGLIIEAWYCD